MPPRYRGGPVPPRRRRSCRRRPAKRARAMLDYVISLGYWNWFIAGAILLLLELIAPGTFMMWLGLSALAVGVISLAGVLSWQAQLIAFAVFVTISIPLWRRFARRVEQPEDQPF